MCSLIDIRPPESVETLACAIKLEISSFHSPVSQRSSQGEEDRSFAILPRGAECKMTSISPVLASCATFVLLQRMHFYKERG